jgi:hypothetical protein
VRTHARSGNPQNGGATVFLTGQINIKTPSLSEKDKTPSPLFILISAVLRVQRDKNKEKGARVLFLSFNFFKSLFRRPKHFFFNKNNTRRV